MSQVVLLCGFMLIQYIISIYLYKKENFHQLYLFSWKEGLMSSLFHQSWSPTFHAAAAAAKLLQLCPTLCGPIDGSPPGSPVPGILQARTLEWVAISLANAWKRKVKVKSLSRVWLCATPWTEAYQAPLSTGFSRQEYWRGFFLKQHSVYMCLLVH